jgi:hypothetical protein
MRTMTYRKRVRRPLTERSPIYAHNNRTYRIVSVANGLWELQRDTSRQGDRERNHWEAYKPPMSKPEAMDWLSTFNILRQGRQRNEL